MKYHNLKKQKWINSIKIISALRVPLETLPIKGKTSNNINNNTGP